MLSGQSAHRSVKVISRCFLHKESLRLENEKDNMSTYKVCSVSTAVNNKPRGVCIEAEGSRGIFYQWMIALQN